MMLRIIEEPAVPKLFFRFIEQVFRDVAQPGSALRSGRRGRWFESSHPDFARRSFGEGGLYAGGYVWCRPVIADKKCKACKSNELQAL